MSGGSVPILFETDIGSDIDDALALAYLLKEPRCELLGVTTVTGEPVVRAKLADAVCQAFGRDAVPVHSGAAPPRFPPGWLPPGWLPTGRLQPTGLCHQLELVVVLDRFGTSEPALAGLMGPREKQRIAPARDQARLKPAEEMAAAELHHLKVVARAGRLKPA